MKGLMTIWLCFATLFLSVNAYGQKFNDQEAFLHLNQPFYISGQKVWYSFFLYDAQQQSEVVGNRFMTLRLIDRNGQIVADHIIKVESGRSIGQFNLASELPTDEYLVHIGFQFEAPEQYLFVTKLKVYNRVEVLAKEQSVVSETPVAKQELNQGADIILSSNEFSTKENIGLDLVLDKATEANLSVQIRKVSNYKTSQVGQASEHKNLRSERELDLNYASEHPYLQFELKRLSPAKDSIVPTIFIPEIHRPMGFFRSKGDLFTIDATNLPAGKSTFYFNQFIYQAYIPPGLEWDYEKARYKDNLVPYYDDEMRFEWVEPQIDFSRFTSRFELSKPTLTSEVIDFAHQLNVNELLAASDSYDFSFPIMSFIDSMGKEPMIYDRTADFTEMDNVAEFLFEIVNGIKTYYTNKRKDIVVLNAEGPFHSKPLVLVNGVPTRNLEKVLDMPMTNIEGIGIIKDHKSQGQYKYNQEAKPYGVFASSGLIIIKLKPDVINPFRSEFDQMLSREVYIKALPYPNLEPDRMMDWSQTPDLRTTLLWDPNFKTNGRRTTLAFYTSDVPGKYEIIVRGIKKGGGFINVRREFEVKRKDQ